MGTPPGTTSGVFPGPGGGAGAAGLLRRLVKSAVETSSGGMKEASKGMIVAEQAGKGVISVGVSLTDALLAVTVTSKPSVTVT
jgi:hypothetical protein